jgi:ABC-type transport system substrate-binding protein
MLLIGVEQGVDPDVFVFWHSSEAHVSGLNFSEYDNELVDAALEAGRTRSDTKLRRAKYESFLQQWRKDAPAIALYRPAYFYAQLPVVDGFVTGPLSAATDRFTSISNWTVLREQQNIQL